MTPRLRRFLPNTTTIGLALIAALLLVNVLVSDWNIERLVHNEHRVIHIQKVLTTLEEVLSTVTEAETAERGFLITDDEQYLKSYESAIARINETLHGLTQLTVDEGHQQELHDGIGQELTGLTMLTQRLLGELSDEGLAHATAASKIRSGLEQALSHVQAMSKGLVPVEIDNEGLMQALEDLAARTSELNGINCTFECQRPVAIADDQTAMHLYRMSQEAVTNAVKHGRPRHIVIRLGVEGDQAVLRVIDDGTGFTAWPENAPENTSGTGLRIMRYRADLIGAQLDISSARPQGTIVTCSVAQHPPVEHGSPIGGGQLLDSV